jgi:hypothetical protein
MDLHKKDKFLVQFNNKYEMKCFFLKIFINKTFSITYLLFKVNVKQKIAQNLNGIIIYFLKPLLQILVFIAQDIY